MILIKQKQRVKTKYLPAMSNSCFGSSCLSNID